MIKRLLTVTALLCGCLALAQTKTPLASPHWNFFDQSGAACAGCTVTSYLAGTTTPAPTYTDASGTSQNTNPIVLGTDGGAMIWVGTPTLKLVLKDSLGSIIWTADNIPSSGGGNGGCGFAGAITFENSTITGLDCDQYITINKTAHTINVGGPLPALHFQMTNLGTITAGWTLDITSKETHAKTGCGGTAGASKYCDGGTGDWTNLPSPGAGTVSSVGASTTGNPLSVTGSPITTSGTLAFTLGVTGSGNKTVTASAAGASGNCPQWDGSGNLGDSGGPCLVGASSLTANGYITLGGLIMQWAQGVSQSSSAITQDINFPTACPTQVFIVIPSSYESVFDDTSMPVFVVISNTLSKATIAMQRVPDHSYNAATPRIEVLCK